MNTDSCNVEDINIHHITECLSLCSSCMNMGWGTLRHFRTSTFCVWQDVRGETHGVAPRDACQPNVQSRDRRRNSPSKAPLMKPTNVAEPLGEVWRSCKLSLAAGVVGKELRVYSESHELCESVVLGKGAKVLISWSAQGICPPHRGRWSWWPGGKTGR